MEQEKKAVDGLNKIINRLENRIEAHEFVLVELRKVVLELIQNMNLIKKELNGK